MFAKDFRAMARQALQGKWMRTALLLLLAALLGAGGGISLSSILDAGSSMNGSGASPAMIMANAIMVILILATNLWGLFMGSWVNVGLYGMGDRVLDGERPRAGMLFPKGIYWKCVGVSILRSLIVFAWSLLLVVPGIIAAYRYAMADYILYRHPEMSVTEVLQESKERMQGRKGRLFCLQISFIGWMLLTMVPGYAALMISALAVSGLGKSAALRAMLPIVVIGGLVGFVAELFLNAYMHVASVAFFRNADQAQSNEQQAQKAWNENDAAGDPGAACDDAPAGDSDRRVTALTADEIVARDVFVQHGCSRKRMRDEGVLEEYEALHVDASFELRWLREYANALMLRFGREPEALDEILDLAAEYAMDDLLTRALERIDRHIRQQSLPDAEILNMAGRVLALVVSGTFDEHPDFMQRRKEQVSDMADRLEARLRETNPDGDWQRPLQLVRSMCGQAG